MQNGNGVWSPEGAPVPDDSVTQAAEDVALRAQRLAGAITWSTPPIIAARAYVALDLIRSELARLLTTVATSTPSGGELADK